MDKITDNQYWKQYERCRKIQIMYEGLWNLILLIIALPIDYIDKLIDNGYIEFLVKIVLLISVSVIFTLIFVLNINKQQKILIKFITEETDYYKKHNTNEDSFKSIMTEDHCIGKYKVKNEERIKYYYDFNINLFVIEDLSNSDAIYYFKCEIYDALNIIYGIGGRVRYFGDSSESGKKLEFRFDLRYCCTDALKDYMLDVRLKHFEYILYFLMMVLVTLIDIKYGYATNVSAEIVTNIIWYILTVVIILNCIHNAMSSTLIPMDSEDLMVYDDYNTKVYIGNINKQLKSISKIDNNQYWMDGFECVDSEEEKERFEEMLKEYECKKIGYAKHSRGRIREVTEWYSEKNKLSVVVSKHYIKGAGYFINCLFCYKSTYEDAILRLKVEGKAVFTEEVKRAAKN